MLAHVCLSVAALLHQVAAEVAAGSPTRYAFFVSFLEIYLEQVGRGTGRSRCKVQLLNAGVTCASTTVQV